ncbi:hypothetical protein DIJ64_01620 [Mycobacterium leprae]|uniref:Uncharacterized protein n=1 Tax=Mycobacterium leprae TaxID=1769 RepID=A0AAD0KR00_MYCLR|nr:hypothetical protein DIJ64_01620 [Mycobacterium leprae]OAR20044.1 hypothetical protein A8144_12645 [Mycobacterium leprae 3125609]OAX70381.1 hypothetical protein A3216_12240 [Mycobacterium leprae 7935681]
MLVAGRAARLTLVGSGDAFDQSIVDLADNPIEKMTDTAVGTDQLLVDASLRLVATRLCWADQPKADLAATDIRRCRHRGRRDPVRVGGSDGADAGASRFGGAGRR